MRITTLKVGSTSPRRLRTLALVGALPLTAGAAFQNALWLGAPYGDAVLGATPRPSTVLSPAPIDGPHWHKQTSS